MISSPSELDLRLALPACAGLTIAFALSGDPGGAPVVAVGSAALVVITVVLALALRTRRPAAGVLASFAVVGAVIAVVAVAVLVAGPHRDPPGLGALHDPVGVTYTVDGLPRVDSRGALEVEAHVTRAGDLGSLDVPAAVRVTERVDLQPGESYAGTGRLLPTEPGARESYQVHFGSVRKVADAPWYLAWANDVRSALARSAATLPTPGSELIPGLATGDAGAVDAELRASMTKSGLTHLIAVSGANCAIVVAVAGALVARLRLRRWAGPVVCGVALVGFVVLVTGSPSVLRASLMCALALLARLIGRTAAGVPLLSATVVALVTADPWLARDPGFTLSVAATAGLLVSGPGLARAFGRMLPAWLASLLAIPVAAQLWCQPILVLLQPYLAPASVPANLLAEPAAPLATAAGLLASTVGALVPPLGPALAALVWVPASWIAAVAEFFGRDALLVPWMPGLLGVLLALALSLGVLAAAMSQHIRVRVIARALLVGGLVVWLGWGGGSLVATTLARPSDWDIVACDVGQGDALLVRSKGSTALIDTGPDPGHVRACLDTLDIVRIDLLVLTHYDLDHAGGVPAVASRVVEALVGPTGRESDTRRLRELDQAGVDVVPASAPMTGTLGDLSWRILWPLPGETRSGNTAGVTIEFCGAYCALFLADLDADAQSSIVSNVRPVDVVKVAHHGSADQFPPLYARLHAELGIISVGAYNTYGHPTRTALDMLSADRTQIVRTDQRGMVALTHTDSGWKLWTERGPP